MEEQAPNELLAAGRPLSVWPINPFRLNERLTLQKGLFLAAGNGARSFVDNLRALHGYDNKANVARFIIPHCQIREVGQELYNTNVTEATLFPGLDGFARSLWTSARYLNLSRLTTIDQL